MTVKESKLVVTLQDDVTKPARQISDALAQAEKRVKEIASEMGESSGASDKFVSSLSRLKLGADDIKVVANEWKNYTTVAGIANTATADMTREQIAGVRSWERATLDALKAVQRERNAETAAMRRAAAEQATIQKETAAKQKELASGMIGMGLGFAGITGVKDVLKAASDLATARLAIQELSKGDPSESAFAEGLAADTAAGNPFITQAKALQTYREIRGNSLKPDGTIDQEAMRRNLGVVSKAQIAAAVGGVDLTPEDAQHLMKAVESSGRAGDPTAMGKMFDAYLRAKQVLGSAIDSSKVLDFVMNAKGANFSLGDDTFFKQLFIRMSEGNASRLGNETAQTLQTLVGGHAQMQTAQWLKDLGLADGFQKTGGGHAMIVGLHGSDQLQTDQMAWANGTLLPALQASGALSEDKIKSRMDLLKQGSPGMDDRAAHERAVMGLVTAEISKSGMRTTVTDNLAHAIVNKLLVDRDMAALGKASGLGAADDLTKSPAAAFEEFKNSFTNFASVVGGPLMAPAAKALDSMAHSIESFTAALDAWQKANPTMAGITSGAVTGGALLGSGSAALGVTGGALKAIGLDSAGGAMSALGGAMGAVFRRAFWPAALAFGAIELGNYLDPKGNWGGALDPLDKWIKGHQLSGGGEPPYEIRRPTPPHTPTPSVGVPSISADPASLDAAFGKISALKDATSQPAEMAVHVETGSIDAALSKALQLRSVLKDVNADALGAASRIPTTSLGSTIRGNFSHGGINGE
jgi:hypothetical protein